MPIRAGANGGKRKPGPPRDQFWYAERAVDVIVIAAAVFVAIWNANPMLTWLMALAASAMVLARIFTAWQRRRQVTALAWKLAEQYTPPEGDDRALLPRSTDASRYCPVEEYGEGPNRPPPHPVTAAVA
jgi:hypothetical protein